MTQSNLLGLFFFSSLALILYLFFDQIVAFAERPPYFTTTFILLSFLLPLYFSFIAQWLEVRADSLATSFLPGGREQMAMGLEELALATEKDEEKVGEYAMVQEERKKSQYLELERQPWLLRLLEFQLQAHPPMYWRIHSLLTYPSWKETRKGWLRARIIESLPSFLLKSKLKN